MSEDKNSRPPKEHAVVDKPLQSNSMEIPPQPEPQPPTTTDTNQPAGGDSNDSK